MCEELESIILLVAEHRHLEICSLVISDDYSLVVSAPKMIDFYLVLRSYLVHIFNSLPKWKFLSLYFVSTFYLVYYLYYVAVFISKTKYLALFFIHIIDSEKMSQVFSSTWLEPNLGKYATIYSGAKPIVRMPIKVAASWRTYLYTTNLMPQGYRGKTTDPQLSFIFIDICWYTWTLIFTLEYLCHDPLHFGLKILI